MSEDLKNNSEEPELNDESEQDGEEEIHHGRRRVKVRKRIRVKRKRSPKRKLKKIFERILWLVIIIGFIASLAIMINQLDISDKSYKKKKTGFNSFHREIVMNAATILS